MLSSSLHIKMPCFSLSKFYYRVPVLDQLKRQFPPILTLGILFYYLFINLRRFIVGATCDVLMCNAANVRNYYNVNSSIIMRAYVSGPAKIDHVSTKNCRFLACLLNNYLYYYNKIFITTAEFKGLSFAAYGNGLVHSE